MASNYDITKNGGYDDSATTTARACSPPIVEYPFQDRGDSTSFTVRQRFTQSAQYYAPLVPLSANGDFPTALYIKDSQPKNIGGGKVEWESLWASVPVSRQEPESFIYQYQTLVITTSTSSTQGGTDGSGSSGSSSVSANLGAIPLTVASTVTYDYYLPADVAAFPLSSAPRYVEIASNAFVKMGTGNLYLAGVFVCSQDAMILADNDTLERYMGQIMVRKRRQIPGPTLAFWGTSLNLPGSFSISPATVGINGSQTLTLTGTNTKWTSSTTFVSSAGGVGGISVNVAAQTATLTFITPATPQTVILTGSDGSACSNAITVIS